MTERTIEQLAAEFEPQIRQLFRELDAADRSPDGVINYNSAHGYLTRLIATDPARADFARLMDVALANQPRSIVYNEAHIDQVSGLLARFMDVDRSGRVSDAEISARYQGLRERGR